MSAKRNKKGQRVDNQGHVLLSGEIFDTTRKKPYRYQWVTPDGKRHSIKANSLQDLRAQEDEIERDRMDGIRGYEANDTTLNQMFTKLMDSKVDIREATRSSYIQVWNFAVKDSLGGMKLSDIRPSDIKGLYAKWAKSGLSESTVQNRHNLIFQSLEIAVDDDLIRKNPAKGAQRHTGKKKRERKAMTVKQQENFLEFVRNDERYKKYYPLIAFDLATGLRAGELLALQWDDIDRKNKAVHVRKQLIYRNLNGECEFHITDLKTASGLRNVPLIDDARRALAKQRELDLFFGKGGRKQTVCGLSDYIFTNQKGKPYTPSAINYFLTEMVKDYNKGVKDAEERLPHISTHILRHTFCSRCAERGLEPKTLQTIMGHSDISMTLNVYTHIDYSHIESEMEEKAQGIVNG